MTVSEIWLIAFTINFIVSMVIIIRFTKKYNKELGFDWFYITSFVLVATIVSFIWVWLLFDTLATSNQRKKEIRKLKNQLEILNNIDERFKKGMDEL